MYKGVAGAGHTSHTTLLLAQTTPVTGGWLTGGVLDASEPVGVVGTGVGFIDDHPALEGVCGAQNSRRATWDGGGGGGGGGK